jgi:thioredoxin 1
VRDITKMHNFVYRPDASDDVRRQAVPQQPLKIKKQLRFSHVLVLGISIVFAAAAIYNFCPSLKGMWSTATAKTVMLIKREVPLTGISYTEDNPVAIVDGKVVMEGDVIDDVRILKIHRHEVDFQKSDRKWTQKMPVAEQGISSGLPVLLQLGSPKCPPCRKMTPILDDLRADYKGKFLIRYIDVWANTDAGNKYGVQKIPTQIFYDSSGRELYRHVGFYSKKEILNKWKKLDIKF